MIYVSGLSDSCSLMTVGLQARLRPEPATGYLCLSLIFFFFIIYYYKGSCDWRVILTRDWRSVYAGPQYRILILILIIITEQNLASNDITTARQQGISGIFWLPFLFSGSRWRHEVHPDLPSLYPVFCQFPLGSIIFIYILYKYSTMCCMFK